jgi:hypothetical protein
VKAGKSLFRLSNTIVSGDLVDNSQIGALAPEFGKPAADNGLRAAT